MLNVALLYVMNVMIKGSIWQKEGSYHDNNPDSRYN